MKFFSRYLGAYYMRNAKALHKYTILNELRGLITLHKITVTECELRFPSFDIFNEFVIGERSLVSNKDYIRLNDIIHIEKYLSKTFILTREGNVYLLQNNEPKRFFYNIHTQLSSTPSKMDLLALDVRNFFSFLFNSNK